MSELKSAIAIGTVHYIKDGKQAVAAPNESVHLDAKSFDELSALGAVREPKQGEAVSPLDHDRNGEPGGSIDELDQLVRKMESGELSLDDSIAAYRRGAELARYCQARLANAEQLSFL